MSVGIALSLIVALAQIIPSGESSTEHSEPDIIQSTLSNSSDPYLVEVLGIFADITTYYLWDDYGGTWHDADKKYDDRDNNMCWAASASNALDWGGWIIGDEGSFAPYMLDQDYAFECFKYNHGYMDCSIMQAWEWWITGEYDLDGYEYWSGNDKYPAGGFHPDVTFEDYSLEYDLCFENDKTNAVCIIDDMLHDGYCICIAVCGLVTDTVHTHWKVWHALTVWGIEYDASGGYDGIYVTDSNDHKDLLLYYSLIEYNNRWWLSDFAFGDDWYIDRVCGLSALEPNNVSELEGMILHATKDSDNCGSSSLSQPIEFGVPLIKSQHIE